MLNKSENETQKEWECRRNIYKKVVIEKREKSDEKAKVLEKKLIEFSEYLMNYIEENKIKDNTK